MNISCIAKHSRLYPDRKAVSHRDLNDWRALTTKLLSRLDIPSSTTEAVQKYIESCGRYILAPIAGWTMETNRQKLEDELLGILSGTLKLSQKLRCQRACWSVRHLVTGPRVPLSTKQPEQLMMLDARAMRDINGDEYDDVAGRGRAIVRRVVEIIISPGLFKRGNTDGQGFDTETCMERSEVKCRESWSEGRSDVKFESPLSVIEVSESELFSEPQSLERLEIGFTRVSEPLQPLQPPERLEHRRLSERYDRHRSVRSDGDRSEGSDGRRRRDPRPILKSLDSSYLR